MKTFKDLKIGDTIYYYDIYDVFSLTKLIISKITKKTDFTVLDVEKNDSGFTNVWLPNEDYNLRYDRAYQLYVDPKAILEDIKEFTSGNVESIFDNPLIFNDPSLHI